MNNYENAEKEVARKYKSRDKKKRQRMRVTGKSVFLIQKLRLQNSNKKRKK